MFFGGRGSGWGVGRGERELSVPTAVVAGLFWELRDADPETMRQPCSSDSSAVVLGVDSSPGLPSLSLTLYEIKMSLIVHMSRVTRAVCFLAL